MFALVAGVLTVNGQNRYLEVILPKYIVRDLVIPGETVTMASSPRLLLSFNTMHLCQARCHYAMVPDPYDVYIDTHFLNNKTVLMNDC